MWFKISGFIGTHFVSFPLPLSVHGRNQEPVRTSMKLRCVAIAAEWYDMFHEQMRILAHPFCHSVRLCDSSLANSHADAQCDRYTRAQPALRAVRLRAVHTTRLTTRRQGHYSVSSLPDPGHQHRTHARWQRNWHPRKRRKTKPRRRKRCPLRRRARP